MLASELLRRVVPIGTAFDVQAKGSLAVVGQTSTDDLVATGSASVAEDLNVTQAAHVVGDVTANNGGQALVSFTTAELDLTGTVAATDVVPARAGLRFVPSRIFAIVTQTGGAISTPPICNIGNNGSNNNMVAASNAFPGTVAFGIGAPMTVQSAPGSPQIPTNTAIRVSVPTAATGTGGFAFKCRYQVEGYFSV